MTLVSKPQSGSDSEEVQVLFKEARRRRLRKRLVKATVAAVVLALGLGLGLGIGVGSTSSHPPPVSTSSPSFSRVVTNATRSAGTAQIRLISRSSQPGCPWTQTTSTGSIDFANHSLGLTAVSANSAYQLCTGEPFGQLRTFGSTVYMTLGKNFCLPPRCSEGGSTGPTTRSKPWLLTPQSDGFGGGDAVQVLQTAFPLAVVDAISHSVAPMGSSTVAGVPVRKYSGNITLAELESSIEKTGGTEAQAASFVSSWPAAIPPPSAIKIALSIWIDSSDRLVRITANQPFFMVDFVGGASSGALQFQPGYNQPGLVPSDYPYVQGYARMTLEFSDFGTSVQIGRPPAKEVASPNSSATRQAVLANPQETCNPQPTRSLSGQLASTFDANSVTAASGSIQGRSWSLLARAGESGVQAVEDGGVVLDGRWYGLCPGAPNPAEFELVDTTPRGIVYGFVANPGNYSIKLTASGHGLPAVHVDRVNGGTFFIEALSKSACDYTSLDLAATTSSETDLHHFNYGTCQANQLVEDRGGYGSW